GRAHPAVLTVSWGVGALLEDRPARAGVAQLVETNACPIVAIRIDRVVDDDRLVVTEVPILEPGHQPVGERVQPLARVAANGRLRDALTRDAVGEIGRASCRERGEVRGGAG